MTKCGRAVRAPSERSIYAPLYLTLTGVFDILIVRVFAMILNRVAIMSTYFPSGKGLAEARKWYVVDAKGKTVGRLATEVARILTGKNKADWTPFLDMGDHVVIINARHAIFKGSKNDQKMYRHHTLYPGGLKEITVKDQFTRHPERVLEIAVRGMLPKNKLGKQMGKKLKVYADGDHRHSAQKPEVVVIETF